MKERKEVLKSVIYSVTPRGSIKTNKPSTVEMTVDHRFANKADELYQDLKEGIEPQDKLIRLELVAVYAEEGKPDDPEQKIQDMSDELDEVLDGEK